MPNPADVGTGTTVAFATSGFNARITAVNGPGLARDVIETTHLGTTGGKTFIPGDLYDLGELSLDIEFDPSLTPPMISGNRAETITITFPTPSGLSSGATWVFSGFMTSYNPTAPLEDKMTAGVTIKATGSLTITPAA